MKFPVFFFFIYSNKFTKQITAIFSISCLCYHKNMSFLFNKLLLPLQSVFLSLFVYVYLCMFLSLCLFIFRQSSHTSPQFGVEWAYINPLLAVTESSWIRDTMANNSRSVCRVLVIGLLHIL